jgi:hypothetical protein
MPICGRKPRECFDTFADHIRPLIQSVLGPVVHVRFERLGSDENKRAMRLGGSESTDWVRLESATYGSIYLYLAQNLAANPSVGNKGFTLKTQQYWYRVFEREPGPEDEPLLRWENAPLEGKQHCKYHFHIGKVFKGDRQEPIELDRNGSKTILTRLHIPTGYVLIEYVLRFLISDLGVKPACGDDCWEDVLSQSQDRFFTEFSPKST